MKIRVFIFLLLFGIAITPSSLFAQAAEINPYAGYYWPSSTDAVGEFKSNQLLGVRGGGYITKNFEIGGNWAWTNHFQPNNKNSAAAFAGDLGFPQGAVRAHIWEAEFTYNFSKQSLFGSYVRPYIVGGAGGLTTRIKDADEFVLNVQSVTSVCGCTKIIANNVLKDAETFFAFSYGGGVKLHRVWGPMGFFGDFRGRTMPNFFGDVTTWPELSAGLTFSWGER